MTASPRALPPLLVLAALLAPSAASAYNLIGGSWPSGPIKMSVQLDASAPTTPAFPLTDGATTWNSLALSAANDWNAVLNRSQFALTPSATATNHSFGDGTSDIYFATSFLGGQTFGAGVLAVTLVNDYDDQGEFSTVRAHEADLIVNRGVTWNSYRGVIRSNPIDLRRVVLHELGHVLGLDHPDEANASDNLQIHNSVQSVSALMNSRVSNVETLQNDDIAGVAFLYRNVIVRPIVTTQPGSQAVSVGAGVTLAPAVAGEAPVVDAFHGYLWYFKAAGATSFEKLFTISTPTLTFGSAQLSDAGSYYLEIRTADDTVVTDTITLTVNPIATSSSTALVNLSTRGLAGSGNNSMIVGFNVTGSRAKTVLLRSVGPTLGAAFGVPGTLADPKLTLKNSSGADVATSAAVWDQSTNTSEIRDAAARVGAFALPAGSRDAVILATLPPGSYSAVTSSPAGATGIVLVEAYDADTTRDPASRLANLSTRGFVNTGANALIAGFVVAGPGPRTYLIRASGDSLRQFSVTGTLDDCILTLFGSGGAQLRVNDDWDSPEATMPTLRSAFSQAGAFAFGFSSGNQRTTAGNQDSAMLVTLPPGNYTAQISGNDNNGASSPTGVALVEIYEMP